MLLVRGEEVRSCSRVESSPCLLARCSASELLPWEEEKDVCLCVGGEGRKEGRKREVIKEV